VRSTDRAPVGGGAPAGQTLRGIGSPEQLVTDKVVGSSQLDGIWRWRWDPVDDCISSEDLRILGKKKGVRHNPNCKGDARLWTSPGAGGQRQHDFKSSALDGTPTAGGGH
jgi:hypothetical protein